MEHGPVAARIKALLARKPVRLALALAALAGLLSPLVPLAAVPGYESASFANLIVALVGAVAGIAAARQERGRAGTETSFTAVVRAWSAAALVAALAIVPVVLAALVAGALGLPCSVSDGLGWYPVLPLPSALLAAALGVLCGAASERRWLPGLLFLAAVVASLVASALPILGGPQVFFYNHLLGYLPGPLYDEVVEIRQPLVWYRLLTLAWAAGVVGFTALCWRGGRIGRPGLRPVAALVALVGFGAAAAGYAGRATLGFEQSTETVARELGGRIEGERCTVIHPREARVEQVRRFVDECDHRVLELEAFFGIEAFRPSVFLYRSAEEKGRLVGASGTQFAKPWLQQLHVDSRGYPHPVLKHELAHLVAAKLGRQPFGVTAVLFGLFPVQGLVEGAAVAADWPPGELTIHEQARAMRELGLAPSLPNIVDAFGFYGESARRAYTYAGSFVRWLVETRGPEKFGRLYLDGDFEAAYGEKLPALVEGWEKFLAGVPLPERARAVAERRFRRPAIFKRPCAREVADLSAEAGAAMAAGDLARAAQLFGRCSSLDAGDPGFLQGQAAAFALDGKPGEVDGLIAAVKNHPAADEILQAGVLTLLGDAHAKAGAWDEALDAYEQAAALTVDRDLERTLDVKREAVRDPELAGAVLPYLADGSDAKILGVRDLLERRPEYATGWYLVGRRLQQRDENELAVAHLDRALSAGLPTEILDREARRVRALALMGAGRPAEACVALEGLADHGETGERLETKDLLGLCRHQLGRLTAAR